MNYKALEKKLGFRFGDKDLLTQVFLHRSYLNEHPEIKISNNERLEFLGDSVLSFVVSEFFFEGYQKATEGKLTNLRSQAVRTETLSKVAEKLGLGQLLLLSKGEDESGGRKNPTLLANVFEALLAAIFLEKGIKVAKNFIYNWLLLDFEELTKGQEIVDFKSQLQRIIQEKTHLSPTYKLLASSGLDHNKTFTVGVYSGNRLLGEGDGKSKQQAEQKAALAALKNLNLTDKGSLS